MDIFVAPLVLFLAAAGSIAGKLIASNFYDRAPSIARWIIIRAVHRLRVDDRARYQLEWLADLENYSGKLDQVLFALACYRASFGLNKRPSKKAPGKPARRSLDVLDSDLQAVPTSLRNLSPQSTYEHLAWLCQDFDSIHERDVAMRASRSIIQSNLPVFDTRQGLDAYIQLVTPRILTDREGGRSSALAATANLLRSSLNLRFDPAFIDTLEEVAWFGATKENFLDSKYGLLIGASLVERFPDRDHVISSMRRLVMTVTGSIETPQNRQAKIMASQLARWVPRRKSIPLETVVPCEMFEESIADARCSSLGAIRSVEAELAVARLESGVVGASERELHLAKCMIDLEARRLLRELSR